MRQKWAFRERLPTRRLQLNAFLWNFTLVCFWSFGVYSGYVFFNIWFHLRWWLLYKKEKKRGQSTAEKSLRFSVLVPARNEEEKIEACVRSVLENTYPCFEVIVLDDQSTDRTAEVLSTIHDPRLQVIRGQPLPHRWIGKNWACHQLGHYAKGDCFVFSDADTLQQPNNLAYLNWLFHRTQADFVSGFPKQTITSIGEGLTVPYMAFMIIGLLPLWLIPSRRCVFPAVANGQYMAIRKAVFQKIGGFEPIYDHIVDDLHLPLLVKRSGGKTIHTYIAHIIQTHMYRNYREAYQGFTKNAFATMGFSYTLLALCIISLFLYQVSPWILLFYHGLFGNWVIPLSVALLSLWNRMVTDRILRIPMRYSFMAPLGFFAVLPILLSSAFKQKTGVYWKERKIRFFR